MNGEVLLQILLVVLIAASILLVAVLWRSFEVLTDIKKMTAIMLRRAKELDDTAERFKETLVNLAEAAKAFFFSFGVFRKIKNAFKEAENKKGE